MEKKKKGNGSKGRKGIEKDQQRKKLREEKYKDKERKKEGWRDKEDGRI